MILKKGYYFQSISKIWDHYVFLQKWRFWIVIKSDDLFLEITSFWGRKSGNPKQIQSEDIFFRDHYSGPQTNSTFECDPQAKKLAHPCFKKCMSCGHSVLEPFVLCVCVLRGSTSTM